MLRAVDRGQRERDRLGRVAACESPRGAGPVGEGHGPGQLELGRGVFTRVLANGDGCEYLFTQFFPASVPDADVDAQVAVVEAELETVRRLVAA